jgi:hypothetical protein
MRIPKRMCKPPKLAISIAVAHVAGARRVMTPANMKAAPRNVTMLTE